MVTARLIKLIDFVVKFGKHAQELMCVRRPAIVFLVRFQGSDEDGAEVGARCGRGRNLGRRRLVKKGRTGIVQAQNQGSLALT